MTDEEYESQVRAEYIYMLDKQQEEITKLQQELQRKDNIINELKKYLKEEGNKIINSDGMAMAMYNEDLNILDKIKELEK